MVKIGCVTQGAVKLWRLAWFMQRKKEGDCCLEQVGVVGNAGLVIGECPINDAICMINSDGI